MEINILYLAKQSYVSKKTTNNIDYCFGIKEVKILATYN